MSANVETMFYTRVAPWHGLGVRVESALNSIEAIEQAEKRCKPQELQRAICLAQDFATTRKEKRLHWYILWYISDEALK